MVLESWSSTKELNSCRQGLALHLLLPLCLSSDGHLAEGATGSFSPAPALQNELLHLDTKLSLPGRKGTFSNSHQGSVPHPTTYNGGTEVTVALLGPEFPWT